MELTEGEKLHPLWIKLYEFLQDRLKTNRLALERDVNEREADKIRGRIAEDKWLLDLNEDVPETMPNLDV